MRRFLVVVVLAVAAVAGPGVAQAADPVYVRNPITNRLHQHPKRLDFRDVDMTSLKWIHWGKAKAIARGKANVLICDPSCGAGHREKGKLRLVLSKRADEGGKRVYQCIKGTITGVPRGYNKISFGC
jgi:hypothetical protein